jgi:hypothetical protein
VFSLIIERNVLRALSAYKQIQGEKQKQTKQTPGTYFREDKHLIKSLGRPFRRSQRQLHALYLPEDNPLL